jgi:hypothetical protein
VSNKHTAGGYIPGNELDELIKRAISLTEDQTEDQYNEFCALVDRFMDKLVDALQTEQPPFIVSASEQQAYMDRQRHKILHSMFDLGRVFEKRLYENEDGGSAFKNFLDNELEIE